MTNRYGNSDFLADKKLSDTEQSVAHQLAYIRRMIVHGGSTQAAEDRLREREQRLLNSRTTWGATRG